MDELEKHRQRLKAMTQSWWFRKRYTDYGVNDLSTVIATIYAKKDKLNPRQKLYQAELKSIDEEMKNMKDMLYPVKDIPLIFRPPMAAKLLHLLYETEDDESIREDIAVALWDVQTTR